jgi:hypothetical protein
LGRCVRQVGREDVKGERKKKKKKKKKRAKE